MDIADAHVGGTAIVLWGTEVDEPDGFKCTCDEGELILSMAFVVEGVGQSKTDPGRLSRPSTCERQCFTVTGAILFGEVNRVTVGPHLLFLVSSSRVRGWPILNAALAMARNCAWRWTAAPLAVRRDPRRAALKHAQGLHGLRSFASHLLPFPESFAFCAAFIVSGLGLGLVMMQGTRFADDHRCGLLKVPWQACKRSKRMCREAVADGTSPNCARCCARRRGECCARGSSVYEKCELRMEQQRIEFAYLLHPSTRNQRVAESIKPILRVREYCLDRNAG
ncbi:uncharacterized protein EI97DRAFT_446346 [Westerdykella ornata]|uniref:Uncharacterized protein n=1 Tax=Westerdykella ornata TaxID=318751 RepID=A0A6A6J587_WESOR|nr:uncharacterized protein EI97DRAFT_446346 [Westerdykella ornata]KAF2271760.1 hypothetical protein EI97DRAFT_446346 [Westerdykella ornata]